MGFHDHLYPSSYYNEEELLASDEYPPPLVNICAKYCVNHLSKTLLEKKKVRVAVSSSPRCSTGVVINSGDENDAGEEMEHDDSSVVEKKKQKSSSSSTAGSGASMGGEGSSSSKAIQEDNHPRSRHGTHQSTKTIEYKLRPGVRLPSELSEKIFAYLDKHTSSAELFRGGGAGDNSSSSSSPTSGDSSSSGDGGVGGNEESSSTASSSEDEVAGDVGGEVQRHGENLAVVAGGGDEERAGVEGNDGNALLMEVEGQEQIRRRDILMRRRRRRRRRRRGMILLNNVGNNDVEEEFAGGNRRIGNHHRQKRHRKKRMLWNGGVVDENGSSVGGYWGEDGEEVVELVEIVGFDDVVGPLFQDSSNLPLTKLNLRTSTAVTDRILATLLRHHPREVDIHECSKLTSTSLSAINANSQNLLSLTIGSSTQILPSMLCKITGADTKEPHDGGDDYDEIDESRTRIKRGLGSEDGILKCPKLMKLVIWNMSSSLSFYWKRLTCSFIHSLSSLDLSGCGEFQDFEFLRSFKGLRSLVLYNVLINGRVSEEAPNDDAVLRRKRVSLEDGRGLVESDSSEHDVEMDEYERATSPSYYVVFLKDEEEGQRLMVGGQQPGEGEGGEQRDNSIEYYQYRKRLERLVNKLLSPICELKELRLLDISTSSDPSTSASLQQAAAAPHNSNLIGSIPCTPWSTYPNPNQVLSAIVQNLPKLTHLDISGTNLAGRGVAVLMSQQQQDHLATNDRSNRPAGSSRGSSTSEPCTSSSSKKLDEVECKLCDIPGLNSRVDNPLEFLGLYGTAHDASHRHCIPAKRVSGDKDEAQILVACEAYIHRHEVLEKVLNDLFHLFRSEKGTHITRSLRLILRAMNLHPTEKHVQISGSASLFYIVKNEQHSQAAAAAGGGAGSSDEVINPPMKRMILSTIVNAMAIHKVDSTMARNGCLTICHFRIPQDVMFIYAKLVKILLKILGQSIGPHQRHESFVERIAIYLLNSLACQVEGWHKRLVGDLGAMKRMLQLIRDRLSRIECDDVMEIAWSTMWNVTDETPENCDKFLKNDGMVLFLKCLHTFPNKPELLRNMMGLLGNVAEVGSLRKQLMTSVFISVFCKLLDSTQDNIEVSYNAAGVLAHMLSDGEEVWGITIPSRSVIQESMIRNVNRWNINSTRNINYRSFEPILRLLRINHTRECQLWASWALANLTRVYPEKYVPLVEKEQGLQPLRDLIQEPLIAHSSPSNTTTQTSSSSPTASLLLIQQDVKKYAQITLQNIEEYNKKGKIDLASFMDG